MGPLLLLVTGCSDGPGATRWTDVFVQPGLVDLLLVVDDAPSMAEEQARLVEVMPDLVDGLARVSGRVGVTSTDGGGALSAVVDAASEDAAAVLADRVAMGADGSDAGEGLAAALAAVTPPLSETANVGFRRDDALLVTLFVSDHDDAGVEPVADLVADLDAVVHAYVPLEATRYATAVELTHGLLLDVTASAYSAPPVLLLARFRLSHTPDPACPIDVEVDNAPIGGWTVEGCDLVFDADAIPVAGTTFSVTYCRGDSECGEAT